MQVVDDKTVLEVGKFYNVRCALMIRHKNNHHYYMPIIGVAHEDNAFAPFLGKHYHVDGRFVGDEGKYISFEKGLTNAVCQLSTKDAYVMFVGEVVIRRRKCKRLITGINPPEKSYTHGKYGDWYKSMIGKSCAGKKCPHLGTTMHERDGVLVCPLHNLHGSLKTEKIINPIN